MCRSVFDVARSQYGMAQGRAHSEPCRSSWLCVARWCIFVGSRVSSRGLDDTVRGRGVLVDRFGVC